LDFEAFFGRADLFTDFIEELGHHSVQNFFEDFIEKGKGRGNPWSKVWESLDGFGRGCRVVSAHQENRFGGAGEHAGAIPYTVFRPHDFGHAVFYFEYVGPYLLTQNRTVSTSQAPDRMDFRDVAFHKGATKSLNCFHFQGLSTHFRLLSENGFPSALSKKLLLGSGTL
jgi:hypothetical protein